MEPERGMNQCGLPVIKLFYTSKRAVSLAKIKIKQGKTKIKFNVTCYILTYSSPMVFEYLGVRYLGIRFYIWLIMKNKKNVHDRK